jgi:predicted nucleic acid-binding protein
MEARRRLSGRDENDWPIVALALQLECPIWTEDRDFFGIGIPTWTTSRIEIFLQPDAG